MGRKTVAGVWTTHHTGTVTLDQLRDDLGTMRGASRQTYAAQLDRWEWYGLDELSVDAWIDGYGHTRQFRFRGESDNGRMDTLVTFLDINKPVTVAVPELVYPISAREFAEIMAEEMA